MKQKSGTLVSIMLFLVSFDETFGPRSMTATESDGAHAQCSVIQI